MLNTLLASAACFCALSANPAPNDTNDPRIGSILKPTLATKDQAKPGIRTLRFDHAELTKARRNLSERGFVRMEGLPLPDGSSTDINLRPIRGFAADAVITVTDESGVRELAAPDTLLFGGEIVGEPESLVVFSISDSGTLGLIDRNGERTLVRPNPGAPAGELLMFDHRLAVSDAPELQKPYCKGPITPPDQPEPPAGPAGPPASGFVAGSSGCACLRVHIEVDDEMMNLAFADNTDDATAYVELLVATNSEIYKQNTGFGWELSQLNMWRAPIEPWRVDPDDLEDDEDVLGEELPAFRKCMNDNPPIQPRDATIQLSGRDLQGGLAYVDVLCSSYAYGICGNMNGFFPMPTPMRSNDNWDITHFAHELGHICGAQHTHSYSPPFDNCGNGDCSSAHNGTIMSYCHLCEGGLYNRSLQFHPGIREILVDCVNDASCVPEIPQQTIARDDAIETYRNTGLMIDVLDNDTIACGGRSITWLPSTSTQGGTLILHSGGHLGMGRIYYRPAHGWVGTDTFKYQIGNSMVGESIAEVTVEVKSQPNRADMLVIDEMIPRVLRFDAVTGEFLGTLINEVSLLEEPVSVSVGPGHTVLVADRSRSRLIQYDGRTGVYLGWFGPPNSSDLPTSHEVRDGYVWITNEATESVTLLDFQTGALLDEFTIDMEEPLDVLAHSNGLIYVVNNGVGNRVQARKATTDRVLDSFCPESGFVSAAVIIGEAPDGDLLVVDGTNGSIQRYSQHSHTWIGTFLTAENMDDLKLGSPEDLELGLDGYVYYSCSDAVARFDNNGTFIDKFVEFNTGTLGEGRLSWIGGLHPRLAIPGATGDLNLDLFINGADLGIMLASWGTEGNPDGTDEGTNPDLDGNGTVDGGDLGMLLANWTG